MVKALITNNESVTRTYTVTFTLLDSSGNVVDFDNGYAIGVQPGTQRPVEAIFLEEVEFDSCRITLVDYWLPGSGRF